MTGQKIAQVPIAGGTWAEFKDWLSWFDCNQERQARASDFVRAIMACSPDDRLTFLEAAHEILRAGWPIVPFAGVMAEASFWADRASPIERKAYALACFNRMPAQERAAFLDYVQGRAAA